MVTHKVNRGLDLWWRPKAPITHSPAHPYARAISPRPGGLDRSQLPDPAQYYAKQLACFRPRGRWASALCCFHEDRRPSLSVNLETGAFRCFACGACGRDLIAFQMLHYRQNFNAACKALGAWKESR